MSLADLPSATANGGDPGHGSRARGSSRVAVAIVGLRVVHLVLLLLLRLMILGVHLLLLKMRRIVSLLRRIQMVLTRVLLVLLLVMTLLSASVTAAAEPTSWSSRSCSTSTSSYLPQQRRQPVTVGTQRGVDRR